MAWAEVCKKKEEEKRTDAEKDTRWQNKLIVLLKCDTEKLRQVKMSQAQSGVDREWWF